MKKLLFALTLLSGTVWCQSTQRVAANLSATCSTATTACDSTANSQLKLSVGEYTMASITVHGTFAGATIFFEFSDDGGVNWYPSTCTRNDTAIQEGSEAITDNTNRSWDCGVGAAGVFRIRLSAISSGTVQAASILSSDQFEPAPTVSISGMTPADATSNTNVPGAQVFQSLFNGTTWDRAFYCNQSATFSVASTITQIVAISGTTKIRVCSFSFNPTTATAGSVDLVFGTGANCGTGTTTLSGAYTLPASAVVNAGTYSGGPGAALITTAGQALCVRTVTSTVAGFVTWAQF